MDLRYYKLNMRSNRDSRQQLINKNLNLKI